jgi:hypothetical protein
MSSLEFREQNAAIFRKHIELQESERLERVKHLIGKVFKFAAPNLMRTVVFVFVLAVRKGGALVTVELTEGQMYRNERPQSDFVGLEDFVNIAEIEALLSNFKLKIAAFEKFKTKELIELFNIKV